MQAISPFLVSSRCSWVFMPRRILYQSQVCTSFEGERDKARPHTMWGHRDTDRQRSLLHHPLDLVDVHRLFLGIISLTKAHKEWSLWYCVRPVNCLQIIVNCLAYLQW